ncbi:unnamed protein product [Ambrosiozyma monospora]|uniref:Unnamed protein product n=1 Tax=Ambrosiozyma monospora TaxID=43982 RepID=A0ACB5SS48_AMBMO|nr:unnamed protein product [Ambrosiozyma monospora]
MLSQLFKNTTSLSNRKMITPGFPSNRLIIRQISSFKATPPSYFSQPSKISTNLHNIREQQRQHLNGSTSESSSSASFTSSTASSDQPILPPTSSFEYSSRSVKTPPLMIREHSTLSLPPPTHIADAASSRNSHESTGAQLSKMIKEGGIGLLLATLATMIVVVYMEQDDKIQQLEKQSAMLKKRQKEMLIQVQSMKKNVMSQVTEANKSNILTQGRMQMHIALLKKQLEDQGMDPVEVSTALDMFEDEIKMENSKQGINLWIPSGSSMKSYLPDAHEYKR